MNVLMTVVDREIVFQHEGFNPRLAALNINSGTGMHGFLRLPGYPMHQTEVATASVANRCI